jgi:hypothetical protein
MSFLEDDLDDLFDDFAVDVVLVNYPESSSTGSTGSAVSSTDTTIQGIFDDAQKVMDQLTGQMVTARPQVTVKSSDVTRLLRRAIVRVGLTDYFVNDILDDGTGITVLQLSEK